MHAGAAAYRDLGKLWRASVSEGQCPSRAFILRRAERKRSRRKDRSRAKAVPLLTTEPHVGTRRSRRNAEAVENGVKSLREGLSPTPEQSASHWWQTAL